MEDTITIPIQPPIGFAGTLYDVVSIIQGYVMIIILVIGVIGNGLSIVVFYRARKRNDATIHYLSILAIADTCCIFFVGVVLWMSSGLQTLTNGQLSINLFLSSTLNCKVFGYFFVAFQCISAWVIAIFSLERAIVVWFPLKRAGITATKRKGLLAFVILSICLVCLYMPILSSIMESQGIRHCFFKENILGYVLLQNSLYYFGPGSIIFMANLFIVRGIVVSRRKLSEKMSLNKTKESQDLKPVMNLIAVSAMYLVFMSPSTVTWTYSALIIGQSMEPSYAEILDQLGELFNQWAILNYCFNFIVYSISLPFYRAELIRMLARLTCSGHPAFKS